MAIHTSTKTRPEDHLLRTLEVEAVVGDLKQKVDNLTAPENPDLTAANAAIDRLFRIVLYGAGTEGFGWTGNPRGDMVFNDTNKTSFFNVTLGFGGYGLTWAQYLTGSGASVVRLTYGNDTSWAQYLNDNGYTLASATFGTVDMLTALDGKSLPEVIYGDEVRAAAWALKPSVIEAIWGDQVPGGVSKPLIEYLYGPTFPPGLADPSLAERITALEEAVVVLQADVADLKSRMSSAEARLSAGGL